MRRTRVLALVAAALLLALAGCFLKKEEGQQKTTLRAGWQVADDMAGWVGVAPSAPKPVANREQKITYHVLSTHNVVPAALHGCYALNPVLFEKTAKIKLPGQNTPESELWQMRPGRRVPKEKEGWIGMPLAYPQITRQGDDAISVLAADQLIPKEMDGWAVIDRETMGRLVADKQMGLTSEPEKAPIPDAGKLKGKTTPRDPGSK
jgi:hypothetical protein